MPKRFAFSLAVAALLAGCTVGPNYSGPPIMAPRAAKAPTFVRTGDAPVAADPPIARWWETLGDTTLTAIEQRAIAANPNVAAAAAKLRQARASLREQKANLLPRGRASVLYAHARFPGLNLDTQADADGRDSGEGGASSIDIYNLGFDASWEVDLFGGQRRAIEAARATSASAAASFADTLVSLTAEVAQAYVNVRDRQRRIALNRSSIAMQEQMLALIQQRFAHGTASRLDVERMSQRVDSTQADSTPLNAELDAYLDELAALTGEEPGTLDRTMATPARLPLPPSHIAIGNPASLLRRRPDIRAAERTLAADTAKIGQAEAARFPSLSFAGIIGIGGTGAADLTRLDDVTTLVAPRLSWSFLDFGRNVARVRQAEGVRDEAEARYRAVVIAALRDAEDSLSRFINRRGTVATLARTKASADEAVAISNQRYAAGTMALIDLLDVRRQQLQAEQAVSISEADLTDDFIAIQKALGLGWRDGDQDRSTRDNTTVQPRIR